MKEIKLNNTTRVELVIDDITSMAHQNGDAMIGVSGRWWKFPGAQIERDSWEIEWYSDGKVYLHDDAGNVIEGIELSDAEIEQLAPRAAAG